MENSSALDEILMSLALSILGESGVDDSNAVESFWTGIDVGLQIAFYYPNHARWLSTELQGKKPTLVGAARVNRLTDAVVRKVPIQPLGRSST